MRKKLDYKRSCYICECRLPNDYLDEICPNCEAGIFDAKAGHNPD